jgi:8-oxo-dGTP pyrophosphatase MutT (NUDIX family)
MSRNKWNSQCHFPITSIGIININEQNQYLMICRKNSLGYVDFIRGKYTLQDKQHLLNLINEMTITEKQQLQTLTFKELWNNLWGIQNEVHYISEENVAYKKFMQLKEGYLIQDEFYTLEELVQLSTTAWETPEWGFPKGRRNSYETEIHCALREYEEETGYDRTDLNLIKNILPYEEIFIGSNYKSYKHKYFIAKSTCSKPKRPYQESEVSDIQWFTLSEALDKIRPYNVEKKNVLLHIDSIFKEYVQIK